MLANGTPHILLPWENAEVFKLNFENHGKKMASWTVWVAPKTMKVADAAKRAGMSAEEFRNVNKIPSGMVIRAGSALLVPRSASQVKDVSAKVADQGQLNLAPEQTVRRQTVTVRNNDSMASVAKRHKVSLTQLAEWNKLSTTSALKPGQKLVVMLPGKAKKTKAAGKTKRKKSSGKSAK